MTDEPLMHLAAITIDCPDPLALARFYARALGGQEHRRRLRAGERDSFGGAGAGEAARGSADEAEAFDPDAVWLELGALRFIFRRDDAYRAPSWPGRESSARSHFDCYVVDLPATEARLHELGARTAAYQPPDATDHVVMLDPAGRPFCISELP